MRVRVRKALHGWRFSPCDTAIVDRDQDRFIEMDPEDYRRWLGLRAQPSSLRRWWRLRRMDQDIRLLYRTGDVIVC